MPWQGRHRAKGDFVKRGTRVVGDSMVGKLKSATGMAEFEALHGTVEVAAVAAAHHAIAHHVAATAGEPNIRAFTGSFTLCKSDVQTEASTGAQCWCTDALH